MISVGRVLEGAFNVFREHFAAVAIWGGIYLACNVAMFLVMAQTLGRVANLDPRWAFTAMGPVWLLSLLLGIVGVVLYTASMRAVLRPDAGGIAFLRLGMDELRMFGLVLLFLLAGMILFVAASLVIGLFIGGVAAGSGSVALAALLSLLVGATVFGVLIFLIVRFSLAFPLTLHRGALAIGEAWRLSRGHFWKLFAAALVVTMIGFALSIAINMVAAGGYYADLLAAAGDPDATVRAAERQAANLGNFSTLMILQSIGGSVVAAVWLTLSGGSVASAARLLIAEEFDDAEDVFG